MKLSVTISLGNNVLESLDKAVALAEHVDVIGVPEAYSIDAVSILGYLAAKTENVELMSAILPIYSRTPTLTAMTAAGIDMISNGRFILGLGASGPQVIEGFHGVKYDAPIGRTREIVEICRKVWRRERVQYDGKHYQLPLPADRGTGLGKSLQLINHPVRERIPVSIAALGPKNVELTAEIAEGWQPVFYLPDKAASIWGESLAAGAAKRDPALGPLDVMVHASLAIGDDVDDRLVVDRLQRAGYNPDSAYAIDAVRQLARLMRADEIVVGTVTRTANVTTISGELRLTRDENLRQPLAEVSAPRVDSAAALFARALHGARVQLTNQRRCENALHDGDGQRAAATAREAVRAFPASTIARMFS